MPFKKNFVALTILALISAQLACTFLADTVAATAPSAGPIETMNAISTQSIPTVTPTLEGVLFQDDFTHASPDWLRFSTDTVKIGPFNSAFRMALSAPELGYWTAAGPRLDDVSIEVDVEQTAGDEASQVGLVCRYSSDSNFYQASISSNGDYSIYLMQANEWTALSFGSANVPQGVASARLRFDCAGEALAFFVNDQLIDIAYDATFKRGHSGLYVDSYSTTESAFLFRNFEVSVPPPDSPALTQAGTNELAEDLAADLALAGYLPSEGELAWTLRNQYELSLSGEHYYVTWQPLDLGREHKNFVLGFDATWETTTGLAGCGAMMRAGEDIGLDAQVRLETWRFSGLPSWVFEYVKFNEHQGFISGQIRSSAAIKQANSSTNHYVIAADGLTFTAYVNGTRLGVGTGPEALVSGQLAVYAWQESGTTACTFSNIWIWDIAE